MSFTKRETENVLEKLDAMLAKFSKENNISVKRGGAKFGLEVSTKVIISKKLLTEYETQAETAQSKSFKNIAKSIGLNESVLFEPLKTKKGEVIILGYNKSAPKYPIQYTINGEPYKCSATHIKKIVIEARPEFGI